MANGDGRTPEQIQADAEALALVQQRLSQTTAERLEDLQKEQKTLKDNVDLLEKIDSVTNRVVGLGAKKLELDQKALEVLKQQTKLERERGVLDDTALDKRLKEIALIEDALDLQRDSYNEAEGAARRFLGVQKPSGLARSIVTGAAGAKSFARGLKEILTPANLVGSALMKVAEASILVGTQLDEATASLSKGTGQFGVFDVQVGQLERSLFQAGVTAEDSGAAFNSLFTNVNDFTGMQTATQNELAQTVAVLDELGVAGDTTAKNLQLATKVLGMTATEAGELTREILDFSIDLGLSQQQVADDLSNFGPMLAALGKEGVSAFKQLEVQVKATGLQVNELLQLTEQFNKFDTAAQAVGKLNALLGGPFLNTLELVNETNPAKRFELLKNSIDKAGLSFDTMDFYQKKALASAIGLNEQQLALMMRGRLDLINEPEKSARDIEQLAAATQQFQSLAEELKQTVAALAVPLGPVFDGLKMLLNGIQELAPALPPIIIGLGLLVGVMTRAAVAAGLAAIAKKGETAALLSNNVAQIAANTASGGAAVTAEVETVARGLLTTAIGLQAEALDKLTTATTNYGLAAKTAATSGAVGGAGAAGGVGLAATLAAFANPATLGGLLIITGAVVVLASVFGLVIAAVGFLVMQFAKLAGNFTNVAQGVRTMVDAINDIEASKAVVFTTAMAPVAAIAMSPIGMAGAVATTTGGATDGGAGGGAGGAAPTINISLSIDGDELSTAVNSVEVSRYNKGQQSDMYNSIIAMIEQGLVKG